MGKKTFEHLYSDSTRCVVDRQLKKGGFETVGGLEGPAMLQFARIGRPDEPTRGQR